MRRGLIFGHSHVWSIRRALASGAFKPRTGRVSLEVVLCGTQELPSDLSYVDASGRCRLNAAIISALHRASQNVSNECLISVVRGNTYNEIGLLTDGKELEFHPPGWPTPPRLDGISFIPYDAARIAMTRRMNEFAQYTRMLSHLGFAHIIHVAAPPPIEENAFVSSKLPSEALIDGHRVSSPESRLKLWWLQEHITRSICESHGVEYLPVPKEARTNEGFLAPEYRKDSVHANFEYAALTLRDIEKRLVELEHPGTL